MTHSMHDPDGPFDVFISYSSRDVAHAEALEARLAAEGLKVWRDRTRLQSGDHVVPAISVALRNSAAVAVLWSDHAVQSRWVQKEADYAEVAGKFLPLALDGFAHARLDTVFREYNCAPFAGVLSDIAAFKDKVLALRAAPFSGVQIRHADIRPVPGFTGREELMAALEANLWQADGGGARAVALHNATAALRGLGGVGKTVLARHYAWEKRGRYHGIWWLRAEDAGTLADDLTALGRRIGLPIPDDAEPEDAARFTLAHIEQSRTPRPWLLVYDNVEDRKLVHRFTPHENAHVLYTTRLPGWRGEAAELPVDVFPRATAVAFLLDAMPEDVGSDYPLRKSGGMC